ncbi:hypothetical protein VP01_917g1 [Puccinia sorghi]|uniref:Uncharacterized protein n=1 Tax=Puccinia sorghi TaxID=27349 RepID=A0A0L6U7F1_9BASI|nr:hypothetical protein VP01_917g1 [Puccinia sorghi]
MTSLDPSHFAALGVGSSNDRTHGGATHAVRLDDNGRMATSSSGSQIDPDDAALPSPTSSFFDRPKELPHRLSSLQLPDLRFEQGYLMSLMPFFHFRPSSPNPSPSKEKPPEKTRSPSQPSFVFGHHRSVSGSSDVSLSEADTYYLGSNFYVEWKMVIYVTLRDQVSNRKCHLDQCLDTSVDSCFVFIFVKIKKYSCFIRSSRAACGAQQRHSYRTSGDCVPAEDPPLLAPHPRSHRPLQSRPHRRHCGADFSAGYGAESKPTSHYNLPPFLPNPLRFFFPAPQPSSKLSSTYPGRFVPLASA